MIFEEPIEVITASVLLVSLVVLLFWAGRRQRWALPESERTQMVERGSLGGRVARQLAPLLPNFKWHASDATFIGTPVDFVIFDGLAALRDRTSTKPLEIVFLGVKVGSAQLTQEQLRVREAVEAKRVRWDVFELEGAE